MSFIILSFYLGKIEDARQLISFYANVDNIGIGTINNYQDLDDLFIYYEYNVIFYKNLSSDG